MNCSLDSSTYEENMKLWPPPLTMIIFSVLQVAAFAVDVLHLKCVDSYGMKTEYSPLSCFQGRHPGTGVDWPLNQRTRCKDIHLLSQ